jgi:hypothetical protein
MVMKQKESRVQTRYHHVLIISGVTNNRHVVSRISR